MPAPIPSVVLHDLTFSWPDGHRVLDAVSGSFPPGSTGLVGLNGVGKSTLLRLIAGKLRPMSGSVQAAGVVDYLPRPLLHHMNSHTPSSVQSPALPAVPP